MNIINVNTAIGRPSPRVSATITHKREPIILLGVSDSGQLLKSQKPKRFRVVEAPSEG